MTVTITADLGAWLVLRRAQWDGVTVDPDDGTLYDHGRRLPAYLIPHVHQLVDRGYLWLGDPVPEPARCRRVSLTNSGERLLDLLDDLSRVWRARHRAGLPRCEADLDTLALVLAGRHRLPAVPGHQ